MKNPGRNLAKQPELGHREEDKRRLRVFSPEVKTKGGAGTLNNTAIVFSNGLSNSRLYQP